MSKADGAKIEILFSEDLTGSVLSRANPDWDASTFEIVFHTSIYVPDGGLIEETRTPSSLEYGPDAYTNVALSSGTFVDTEYTDGTLHLTSS